MSRKNRIAISTLVFLIVFSVYVKSKVITITDSKWILPTAWSIVKEKNLDISEYKEMFQENDYHISEVNGKFYLRYSFQLVNAFILVPFVFIANIFFDTSPFSEKLEKIIASFIVSLVAVVIYFIFHIYLNNRYSILLTFVFAFCTPAWSTASRALWQHGPSMLMLAIVLYLTLLTLLARNKPWLIQFVAMHLIFSYIVRPANILSVIFFTVFIWIQFRDYFFII